MSSEDEICYFCRNGKDFNCYTLYPYYNDFRFLVYLLKYDLNKEAIRFWADKVHSFLHLKRCNPLLIPVPSRPENKRKRGGDGVLEICRYLKKHYGYEYASILKRKKGTISQKKLSREDRLRKIHGNYYLKPLKKEYGRVILIDDVVTTGATMQECFNLANRVFADIRCLSLTRD